ncbi:MAG: hypothetical protein NC097_00700 [Clostridium sp.]|nr:hypothetical protein [Prevotella sp.]MCM1428299.1 hypothetical protein [Clostridium sp.]MCM1474771.1 hypothetical protein [Muribaculaceae bacterium]
MNRTIILILILAGLQASLRAQNIPEETERQESRRCTTADTLAATATPGKFIWVPDTLSTEVEKLLKGHSKVVPDDNKLDPNEVTVFRGDTIPMVLRDRNFGRYHRGLYNHLFMPKGMWTFGITASYGELSTSDVEMFDVLTDIDLGGHTFAIRPYISYFIRNNLSVGIRLNYTSSKADISSFKVDIDDDMNFNLHDINYRNESYSTAIVLQQYIGIARRGRFGVYNEVALEFASGNSTFRRPFNDEPKETHTTYMDARLSFSPGVCVLIMKNVSFNLSFGVFGFYLRNEKQKENGEPLGNRFTSGASFKFNIFNIAFGLGVHI